MKVAQTLLILITILSSSITTIAQNEQEVFQQEIDTQVWKPFCEAYAELDAEKFNSVHTDDVIRATPWGLRIGDEYKERNRKSMAKNKKEGEKRTIELWFEHRVTNPDLSYEVGYYKVISQNPGKEPKEYYGRFHCVIKKVNGIWKIAQDWDDGEINGHKVGAEDWAKGTPLKF